MSDRPKPIDAPAALLAAVDIFSALTDQEREYLARQSDLVCADADTIVLAPGSSAHQVCVVADGSVVVRTATGNSRTTDIAKYVAGESFGELDLLRRGIRDVAVVADTACALLLFPRAGVTIETVMQSQPGMLARIMHRMLMLVAERIRSTNRLISENSPWVQQLRTQVYVDKLTGAYNRAFLDEEVPGRLAQADRYVVLMAKPDNFKAINDSFGHEVGDRAIELYARTLSSILPPGALLGRYMSNEMAIVAAGMDPASATEHARALHETLTRIDYGSLADQSPPTITYCVGVVTSDARGADPSRAVAAAHEALFSARDRGGNRVLLEEDW